jgi:hypothetical protein
MGRYCVLEQSSIEAKMVKICWESKERQQKTLSGWERVSDFRDL